MVMVQCWFSPRTRLTPDWKLSDDSRTVMLMINFEIPSLQALASGWPSTPLKRRSKRQDHSEEQSSSESPAIPSSSY